jgi:site-specific recombinase XerD
VNDYMTMAKTFFSWCVRQELLQSDPTSKWDRTPEPRREIKVLDRTEVAAMLGVVKDAKVPWLGLRDYWMIRTLYGCGLRASEVCRLRMADVDTLKNRYRVIGKGPGGADRGEGKERFVPFSLEVRRAYLAYLRVRPKVGTTSC